ncbi:unannotated protein [freshwater metagenome]|uniref:Unannotated protein n=1 Tax=freshwater metagenome TaxID=449393 RepID=A0A6J7VQX1_9ZZZZ
MIAVDGDLVNETKVTIAIPIKWPINGINPQTNTTIANGPE